MNYSSSRLLGGFFMSLCLFWGTVTAQAATLLPNGKQVFVDQNGAPLASGTVQFYVPGSTTPKTTWQDAAQTILNTNPIVLDVNGSAIIYGSGCYRQIVKTSGGVTIWDQPTCDTSSSNLIWAGHSSGPPNNQALTAPNFTLTDGQTIAFIAGVSNTGPLGLLINGGSSINVLKDLISSSVSLTGGEVSFGNVVMATYDATRGAFHLINNPVVGASPITTLSGSGTTDLGSAGSRIVTITGSASITSFGSSASTQFPNYILRFTGSPTLVNSANMILPNGANLSLFPNDTIQAIYLGSGAWQVFGVNSGGIPGEIRSFARSTCPSGWLEAAGQSVSSTTYPNLSAALGTTWGTSSGNVVLPDSRGRFARGFDNGAGVDSGRTFGTTQGHQLQDHIHSVPVSSQTVSVGSTSPVPQSYELSTGSTDTGNPTTGNHGSETRPVNFTVMYCVKF
jgi:microcystin-dependent protein